MQSKLFAGLPPFPLTICILCIFAEASAKEGDQIQQMFCAWNMGLEQLLINFDTSLEFRKAAGSSSGSTLKNYLPEANSSFHG